MGKRHDGDDPAAKHGATGQDLAQFDFRRQCFIEYLPNVRVAGAERRHQVGHDHELVAGHKNDQIRFFGHL